MNALPKQFEESIRQQLGREYPKFISSLSDQPPVSLRRHPIKGGQTSRDQPVPWSQYGEYLSDRPTFTLDPLFHAGCYYVQEASSMFLEQALRQAVDLDQSLNVLDLCAAPGGKSTHILSLLNRKSLLVSNETIRSRATILSENIQKWGYPNCIVSSNDPADFRKLGAFFDVVVVDAPCSGEGLFRKDNAAMVEWSPGSVQLCASRQKRIVSDVWDAIRGGGILIYCTCTYNPDENEKNLEWVSSEHGVESIRLTIDPLWGIEEVNASGIWGYRFYPHRVKGEGFFLSVLRKADQKRGDLKWKGAVGAPLKHVQDRLSSWLRSDTEVTYFQFNELVFYAPSAKAKEMELLLQSLKIIYAGTNMGAIKHNKIIPDHALALSVDLQRDSFPVIEVDERTALSYLRRESIDLPSAPVGFAILTFANVPIGWVNVLSNRVNNMYPTDWRIRMSDKGGSR